MSAILQIGSLSILSCEVLDKKGGVYLGPLQQDLPVGFMRAPNRVLAAPPLFQDCAPLLGQVAVSTPAPEISSA